MPATDDNSFMRRCFELAGNGLYTARPNPMVGAVIVRGGKVIGEGWHERPGGDHAEIVALKQAGEAARGADLYVSLEPCCHTGRTGPCSDAVIDAGIARVFYGVIDPNPAVSGQGIARLEAAGITTQGPLLEEDAAGLIAGFIMRMRDHRPLVRCKLAMSLDGRTAMASGESKWITGEAARADVHLLRARSGAVMTGIETVLADDPALTARPDGLTVEQPLRVVVDSRLRIPDNANIFKQAGRVLVATAVGNRELLADKQAAIGRDNVAIMPFAGAEGRVDLAALLRHLADAEHCNEVLLETGAALAGAMLEAGLIDEVITYIAPSLLGSKARPLFRLDGMTRMDERHELEIIDVAMVGKDCRMRSRVKNTDTPQESAE